MNLIREIKLNNTWLLSGRSQKGSDIATNEQKENKEDEKAVKVEASKKSTQRKRRRSCTMFAYQIVYNLQAWISEYQIEYLCE